jgi:hypothetical protein
MKAKLNKTAQALIAAGESPKDGGRPVLQCLCLKNGAAAASNGFMLATAPAETEGDGEMLVPINLIQACQEASSLAKKNGIEVEEDGADIVGTVAQVDNFEVRSVRRDYAYPQYEKMCPTSKPKAFISLSGDILKKLVQVVGDDFPIFFRIREPNEPVEFVSGDVHGFLMPMSTSTSDKDVEWWGE